MTADPVLVRFARDFSKGDPDAVARAQAFAAAPPTVPEQMGFYGSEDYGPQARAYLATVSHLNNEGHVQDVEDKYVIELLHRWRDEGRFSPDDLPPAAKAVFGPMLADDFSGLWDAPDALSRYVETFCATFAEAAAELDAALAGKGDALLSIDATDGDTVFFAFVAPEIAERWRDKALCEYEGYVAGVRSPMWDRMYAFLGYGLGLYHEPGWREAPPPGTPSRKPDIPFAL
ncbi:hypothetical protein [Chenggangzhangella methanolivorans]|uniref:Uncharacterized protein n=2 Tax=Chenggangzhangella methanolivorans TaxID=1437009 RepID=A0A9E6ULS8_9HYPH|nr:hypothetical protein [Chenggangzhangella methanolivorans]QZO00887.1 hypothetical protein K6K41_04390 [Chenggangzhangella methanolivorans]